MEQLMKTVILPLITDYGIPLTLVVFFVWRDYKREASLSGTIRKLEDEMRTILKEQVTNVTRALTNNTSCMREIIAMLRTRPCVADELAEAIISGKLSECTKDNT
ncbi:MAG: hypothetical protein DRH97_01710 [Chloroflexi bacterium]|nr:MAG: hypothetical protein DRH97_01710 [Chloroflexota bacterium]